jgi:hypothetical protein
MFDFSAEDALPAAKYIVYDSLLEHYKPLAIAQTQRFVLPSGAKLISGRNAGDILVQLHIAWFKRMQFIFDMANIYNTPEAAKSAERGMLWSVLMARKMEFPK